MSLYQNDNLSALDYVQQDYLRELQLERLKKIVSHAYNHVALFRSRMDERKLRPEDVKTLSDLGKLPFMVKADLRDTYPFGLFAVPMSQVVRLHASSGTTGKPIVVGYTRQDLEVWMEVMKRALASCGLTNEDIIQVGQCFSVEPGIYLPDENIGVRIEDLVIITEDGCEVLNHFTKDLIVVPEE